MIRPIIPLILAAMATGATSAPLAEGTYVDFVVVPIGPVALAEFESDPAAAAAGGANPAGSASPDGPGSGVRVKETDPSEIPPSAIYLEKGGNNYHQLPCYLNSVGVPVRTPVTDSEIRFMIRSGSSADSFIPLEKCTLPQTGGRILVLLTKPLGEKRWTSPKVTLIPLPQPRGAGITVVNASQGAPCGLVIDGTRKTLLPPLRHQLWSPPAKAPSPTVALAMAMGTDDGTFLPAFYDDRLPVTEPVLSLVIAYDVTPQESFRRAKYVTGILRGGEFRHAEPFPPRSR